MFTPDARVWLSTKENPQGHFETMATDGAAPTLPSEKRSSQHWLPPALPAELRTCGQTFAGGGVGWHVIRNRGDVWQRIAWVVEPKSPEVRALPPDAYPLAAADGALCGWGRQYEEREWDIHHGPSGKVIRAIADQEHAPARCLGTDGTIAVDIEEGVVIINAQGEMKKSSGLPQAREPARDLYITVAAAQFQKPLGQLRGRRKDGSEFTIPLLEQVDVDGTPWAAGTVRTRIASAFDGDNTIVLAERILTSDCLVAEHLFVVDVRTAKVRRIATTADLIVRLAFAAGRFVWVEAEPIDVDLEG